MKKEMKELNAEALDKVTGGAIYENAADVQYQYNIGETVRFYNDEELIRRGTIVQRRVESYTIGDSVAITPKGSEKIGAHTLYSPIYKMKMENGAEADVMEDNIIGLA